MTPVPSTASSHACSLSRRRRVHAIHISGLNQSSGPQRFGADLHDPVVAPDVRELVAEHHMDPFVGPRSRVRGQEHARAEEAPGGEQSGVRRSAGRRRRGRVHRRPPPLASSDAHRSIVDARARRVTRCASRRETPVKQHRAASDCKPGQPHDPGDGQGAVRPWLRYCLRSAPPTDVVPTAPQLPELDWS